MFIKSPSQSKYLGKEKALTGRTEMVKIALVRKDMVRIARKSSLLCDVWSNYSLIKRVNGFES
jgi:hypothetical protein